MPAKPIRSSHLPHDPPGQHTPLVSTVVVASYKGGVGKTALAVAIAERLAWGGLRVLLITCDSQQDARARLGVRPSEPASAHRAYGHDGSITVLGLASAKAVELLYRTGPERFGVGMVDVVVLDTPPEVQGGSLPGVLLVTPVDGADAARNLVTMLRRTPANTAIMLVRLGREDPDEWAENVEAIQEALDRSVQFLAEPLPKSARIASAHNEGESVWTIPRAGGTRAFLGGVDALARMAWERLDTRRPWLAMPPASASAPYVLGWDDEA